MLLLCVGCSNEAWTFSHGEPVGTSAALVNLPATGPGPAAAPVPGGPGAAVVGPAYQPAIPPPGAVPDQRPAYPVVAASYGAPENPANGPPPQSGDAGPSLQYPPPGGNPVPPGTVAIGPMPADVNWLAPSVPETAPPQGVEPATSWQPPPGSGLAPVPSGGVPPPAQPPARGSLLATIWDREVPSIRCDYINYYSLPTAIELAAGVGVAAGLANSDLDGEFAHWYQHHVASLESNRVAHIIRPFGEGQYVIPVTVSLALLDDTGWLDDRPALSELGQWGDRVSRAYLVGGPPMLAMQYITGGSRPSFANGHSSWKPFSASNGVSGDAFLSSCMFITAADMSDQIAWKGLFYACSFIIPWERIDLNDHYLSQAALGWWMGYLACQAVNNTELSKRNVMILPMVSPEMTGVGVMYQH
jgi:hypothetical protein